MITTEVPAERADIEAAIAGRTVPGMLADMAAQRPDSPALHGDSGSWTWAQVGAEVRGLAGALRSLGVGAGDVVGIMASNRPEHVLLDLGASAAGATTTTLYATLAAGQIRHVVVDSGAKVVLVEGDEAWWRWRPVLAGDTGVEAVIALEVTDPEPPEGFAGRVLEWADLRAAARDSAEVTGGPAPEDTAVLIYTSGTTGSSKGVRISHRALLYEVEALVRVAGLPEQVVSLSYLPLAHVAERVLSVYLPLRCGGETHFCPRVRELPRMLPQVRPTIMFGVPQVWERLRGGIERNVAEQGGIRSRLGRWALRAGAAGVDGSAGARLRAKVADRLVLRRIPAALGLDRCEIRAVGAAPLPPELERFFAGIGLELTGVYGLSETCGAAVMHRAGGPRRAGTVGAAMPGVELRIAEDGEVLVRAPLCADGYRNLPEADRELFTADGWLRTGDLGELGSDGLLRITGRKKDVIITAGGKNISPAAVESLLVADPLVGQALVCGDNRPHLVALLMPDPEELQRWAAEHGLAGASRQELVADPRLRRAFGAAVQRANERLARVEQVRAWEIAPGEWSEQGGELTPTGKLRRSVVAERHRDLVDGLYG